MQCARCRVDRIQPHVLRGAWMSESARDEHVADHFELATGGELATRVFTISIVGVFAAILLMIIIAHG